MTMAEPSVNAHQTIKIYSPQWQIRPDRVSSMRLHDVHHYWHELLQALMSAVALRVVEVNAASDMALSSYHTKKLGSETLTGLLMQ